MPIALNPLPSSSSRVHTSVLISHPDTPTQVVHEIEAHVRWHQERILSLSYTLSGDHAQFQIPALRSPARADDLWRHTCFEAFVALPGDPAYQEWNFSPSGEWALYHFRDYRKRLPLADNEPAPEIDVRQTPEGLTLEARLLLPYRLTAQPLLQFALSAVIEDAHGNLSYWALTHPPGKPDFHRRDAFVLEIAPPHDAATRKEPS
ncbi:MAG: DOMON-like domain-containing protein [Deltaproteobacteria bacterium]|nr:DOMON-like domain-containing protein [Deltaproteobacteria bacterium]